MKKIFGLLLALMLLLCAGAVAQEDVFIVNAPDVAENAWDESNSLTSDRSYLRVTCPMESEANVTLSVADEAGSLVYQRDYGLCSGTFRSEDIFLRLMGSSTIYHVSLWVGDVGYAFPIQRVMPRLIANAACSAGLPLQDITGSGGWKSATLLDVSAMEGQSLTVPLHASNAYCIGSATFAVDHGRLTVSVQLDQRADATVDRASVQVATTALEAQTLGRKGFMGQTAQLEQAIDLESTPYAAVYLSLTVSFDPTSLPESSESELEGQRGLWQLMQTETANEAVG